MSQKDEQQERALDVLERMESSVDRLHETVAQSNGKKPASVDRMVLIHISFLLQEFRQFAAQTEDELERMEQAKEVAAELRKVVTEMIDLEKERVLLRGDQMFYEHMGGDNELMPGG